MPHFLSSLMLTPLPQATVGLILQLSTWTLIRPLPPWPLWQMVQLLGWLLQRATLQLLLPQQLHTSVFACSCMPTTSRLSSITSGTIGKHCVKMSKGAHLLCHGCSGGVALLLPRPLTLTLLTSG